MNKRTKEDHTGDRAGITRLLVCAEKCTAAGTAEEKGHTNNQTKQMERLSSAVEHEDGTAGKKTK